jgi:hypothetical protein
MTDRSPTLLFNFQTQNLALDAIGIPVDLDRLKGDAAKAMHRSVASSTACSGWFYHRQIEPSRNFHDEFMTPRARMPAAALRIAPESFFIAGRRKWSGHDARLTMAIGDLAKQIQESSDLRLRERLREVDPMGPAWSGIIAELEWRASQKMYRQTRALVGLTWAITILTFALLLYTIVAALIWSPMCCHSGAGGAEKLVASRLQKTAPC